MFVSPLFFVFFPFQDHQKLEREARICRLLKHPNIGELQVLHLNTRSHKSTDTNEKQYFVQVYGASCSGHSSSRYSYERASVCVGAGI